jgi:ubiquinone/menaquinone biosynthesis C-methylase UbiE
MTGDSTLSVEHEVARQYGGQHPELVPTERTMFLNLGYWLPGCATLDDACEAMADLLSEAVGMGEGDTVLDVGFGFGDQDMRWVETRSPAKIYGLNVTAPQVEVARRRVRERGLEDRIDLRVGSATEIPFDPDTFDRVTALECAFHFDTRQDFVREAYRVLRPGGVFAAADMILRNTIRQDQLTPEQARRRLMPSENWCDRETYIARLEEAGFVNPRVRSISANVYLPLVDYLKANTDRLRERHPAIGSFIANMEKADVNTDYVIATAEKPS